MSNGERPSELTDEEMAAALAAVRVMLRRRRASDIPGARWMRAGRAEAVGIASGASSWASAERPR